MRVPRKSSWLLLLIFSLWILEAAVNMASGQECTSSCQMSPQLGLFGSSVVLSCVYPNSLTFTLSKTTVYWQTEDEDKEVVHIFTAGQDDYTNQNKRYVDRTQLLREGNERNFSLQLSRLTLRDSKNYTCVVLLDEPPMKRVLQKYVTLKVAARFSRPVVTGPTDVYFGDAVVLNCSASNGYPAPKVYWIDSEDGRVIDPSLFDNLSETDPDTQLYSVRSQLTVNATSNMSISCLVENPVLRENLTSSHYNLHVLSHRNSDAEKQFSKTTQATVGVLIVILLAGVLVGGWLCKKSFCQRYKGVPDAEAKMQRQPMEQRTSLDQSSLLHPEDGRLQSWLRMHGDELGSCGSGNETETATQC